MPNFSNIIGSADVSDAMLPDQIIDEIIKSAPQQSAILSRVRHIPMSTKKAKQPVLNSLPMAYWVNGNPGLAQTTEADWKDAYITAEEIAAIVPIPRALLDDADVPLWEEVKPLLNEAVGGKVDAAGLFGTDKPESWPEGIVPAAIAAGNTVVRGTGKDLGVDIASLGEMLSLQGYAMDGFASRPGMQWQLRGLRNAQGDPIYTQTLAGAPESGLYGWPLNEVGNGAWDQTKAEIVGADWTKYVVGMRRDITYDIYKEGVISDENGKVVLNLMQQQCYALVVTARIGFACAKPKTRLNGKYPAGVILPAGYTAPKDPSNESGEEQGEPTTQSQEALSEAAPASLESMTVSQLHDYADENGIDLSGCSKKGDILDAIAEAEA